ncbi:MAG: sulfatase [Gemmataceae bacterium]
MTFSRHFCCLVPFLLAALALMGPGPTDLAASQAKRPNFILILVDDMGWTDLGCQGSDVYQTPNLDQLAQEGMRFTNGYAACTVCSPTRAAVMTGKYPARLHITDWIHGHQRPNAKLLPPDWTHYLPSQETTIAEVLKAAGYATCHIGKWHLGDEPEHWPDKQGFDHNIGGYGRGAPPSYFSPYKIPTLKDGPPGEYLTDREANEAVKFIEANKDKPFFLYLPHYAVHTPLQGKKDVIVRYQQRIQAGMKHTNAIYAAMVEGVDDAFGTIHAKLKELRIADNTVIIFTSDNGGLTVRGSTNNTPLREGKGSTYEGGVRVPLLVKWPGVTKPGSVCHEPVMSIDYLPTILDIVGVRYAAARPDGASIVPLLKNPRAKLDRDAIYWHYPHYHPGGATPYSAIRAGDWKLIEFFEDNHVELYHLKDDLSEKHDLADKMPNKTNELRARLHAWRKAVGAQLPKPNPAYPGAEK